MRNIFQARTATEAAVVQNLLMQNGIDARLVEKTPSFSGIQCSEVWISDDTDRDRAVQLVRGLYSNRDDHPAWACSKCREPNPDSFESCWQCNADRTARGIVGA
jgi:hypothetical protein